MGVFLHRLLNFSAPAFLHSNRVATAPARLRPPGWLILLLATISWSLLATSLAPFPSQGAPPPQDNVAKIGVLLPLHGHLAGSSAAILRGAGLALAQANLQRLLPGYHIKLVPKDNVAGSGEPDPNKSQKGLQELLADPQVIGVIGPLTTAEVFAVLPTANRAGLALVSPAATDPRLTKKTFAGIHNEKTWQALHPTGKTTFFRVVPSDEIQGQGLATVARQSLKSSLAVVIHDGSLLGLSDAETFRQTFSQLHGTILQVISLPPSPPGLADPGVALGLESTLRSAKNVDALFFAGAQVSSNRGLAQVLTTYHGAAVLADAGSLRDTRFNLELGSRAKGAIASNPVPSLSGVHTGRSTQFVQAYRNFYQDTSDPGEALGGYTAAQSLVTAFARVVKSGEVSGSLSQHSARVRQKVVNGLLTGTFSGVLGDYQFDANGDTTRRVITLSKNDGKQWRPTQTVQVAPASASPPQPGPGENPTATPAGVPTVAPTATPQAAPPATATPAPVPQQPTATPAPVPQQPTNTPSPFYVPYSLE